MAQRVDGAQVSVALCARRMAVRGVVQGVGFRPFVYRLAQQYGIAGWVRNTSWGVEMEVEGTMEALAQFVRALREQAPPLAHIESLTEEDILPSGHERFEIVHSEPQDGAYQLISPDIATCADCQREIFDPQDRRYRYPFTNCTNCGPRFTIIEDVPYDRPLTTMRAFTMCPTCQREYNNPLDRRFHAQPNACPVCGPQLTLLDAQGQPVAGDAMAEAVAQLRQGHIVAIKGLGGYQLACDATNAQAVARLRERKRRPHKPFAVMVANLTAAEQHAHIMPAERELLTSSAAPIVLLPWRASSSIAREVAPNSHVIGLMLPYTPLHHILLGDVGLPLIMTSGNLSEEPIARDNDEALRRLAGIADYFLTHNRDIYARYDDSVWFAPVGGPQPIRRARGYAPFPLRLPYEMRPILACGAELKNTFCLTRERYAFLSQHIGDMQNLETLNHYEETIALYERLFHVKPEVIAHDMHPDYMATRYALSRRGLPHVAIQHHHAHLAACLADAGETSSAIGVILDGTGYGLDGRIWGGEFLVGDARGFQRAAHLEYLPLPGGEGAIHKPYRLALAYTRVLLKTDEVPEPLLDIPEAERRLIAHMVDGHLQTPLTSSAGRLFDAVSALLGVCCETSYEAQAAIELEMLSDADDAASLPYPYEISASNGVQAWGHSAQYVRQTCVLRLAPLWKEVMQDISRGMSASRIGRRFHASVAQMVVDVCQRLRAQTGLQTVALSGGCFQNRLLLALIVPRLQERGFRVLMHRQVPCNDGGLALGQAVIAHLSINGE